VRVWRIADAAGPNVVRHLCAALPDHDVTALEAEYGLTIAPICTEEQMQIKVEPLLVPGPPIAPPTPALPSP
jgi:hypothetical protein